MSFQNNKSEGVPLSNNNENSSLPVVYSSTQNSSTDNLEHMSSERIIITVKELITLVSSPYWERARRQQDWVKFHTELESQYRDFKVAYPALFRMVIEQARNFDMNQLIQFLSLREQMMAGQVQEKDAHQFIGQSMVDKYVKPHLPEDQQRK